MAYKGTAVTRGAGEGVVVATGMDTELGHISSLVEEAEEEVTPLERRLQELGHRLIWVTLGIAAVVVAAGIIAGKDVLLMVETGVALAVASIPEGLPIVATVALARGMWRMARRNALINQLSAVETLGATNVILTDKTGTLTENQMTAIELALPGGTVSISGRGLAMEGEFSRDGTSIDPSNKDLLQKALEIGVLCNNASLQQEDGEIQNVGDPSEVALLVAGAKAGMRQEDLLERKPEEREVAFDPEVNMMATYHRVDGRMHVAVKGAPNAVLEVSSHIRTGDGSTEISASDRERWLERNEEMAAEGLRVLALAEKQVEDVDAEPYRDLTFVGLIGLLDPPREDVRDALTACQEAGIRVVMITGDQPVTARKVGLAVGLIEEDAEVIHGQDLADIDTLSEDERQRVLRAQIFARVSPEQKLDLIALHQDQGAVVAMTGDGVNDAPALKKADIGVAMGQRGTQVAKEAADMVLKDDAFSTIVAAVEQGRAIFNNIRRFVLYLLSCNVAEVFTVGIASLANMPLPIRPLQILFLNLVTDVFPALALGMGEGDPTIMDRPPRDPEEPVMTWGHWGAVGGYGLVITLSVLGSLLLAIRWLGMDQNRAVTVSFLTLASAQLWHVFDMRDRDANPFNNDVTQNPYVWGALGICILLLLAAVYLPGLSDILGVVDPGLNGWALVGGASVVPLIIGQIALTLRHWQEKA
jgi:Ca2+-transporting ATPase